MNLEKDIPDFDIMPSVLAYLKQEHASITQEYKNIFNLCLYDGTQRVFGDDLQADAQLNLTTRVPCDLRRTYRLRFSILTDISLIEEASLVRLRPQRALVNQLVVVLNTVLRNKAIEPDIAKNTLSIRDYLLLGYSLKEAQDLWGQNNTGSASDAKNQFLQTLRTFFTAATIEIHNWS
jgi:hypothetical protein